MKKTAIIKLIGAIPFLILVALQVKAWLEFAFTDYGAEWRHYLGLLAVLLNLMQYFINYRRAVFWTGIVLLLSIANLLAFFPEIVSDSFSVGPLSTPHLQLWPFPLLALYGVINYKLLVNYYLDWEEEKANRKKDV